MVLCLFGQCSAQDECSWFTRPTWSEPANLVKRSDWGSQGQPLPAHFRHRPNKIVVHHSGVLWKSGTDPVKKVRALQAWGQREKNWADLPYHYLITPDGQVFEGRDWHYQPESNTKYPLHGVLNVQLFGNFEEERPTAEQLASMRETVSYLRMRHKIRGHRISAHSWEAPGQTSCPGQHLLPFVEQLQSLR